MSAEQVTARAREFVKKNFLYARPDFELRNDIDLLEAGIVDSMGVMELIEFLEREFEIQIGDDEITEENLGTLELIGHYIEGKKA